MFHANFICHAMLAGLLLLTARPGSCDEKYKLDEPVDDARVYGVGTRVDIKGTVNFPQRLDLPQTMTSQPQVVSAKLSYRERRLLGPGEQAESFRSAREYETAQCDIRVGDTTTGLTLPDTLKLIVAQGRMDGVELYGLNGLLTDDELNLIRSPADSLALISLLPAKEVEIGEKWKVPGWAFQMLTGLDAVAKGELECTFDSVKKGIARINMDGKIEGAAVGSFTEVKVTGFFSYNLEGKYICDTDFLQTEKRSIGPISPGLEINARIRLLRQPSAASGKLGDHKIIDVAAIEPLDSAKFMRFESPWNIGVQHSRNWHSCQVDERIAKFRLLVEGNLIAECDMASIPAVKPGEHLSEQKYLADIRQSLGERMKTISRGEVIPSNDRKFIYRVSAEGLVGERKMTWVFYLVADPTGRQASLMFTADTEVADKLVKHDREIVDSLKFGPAPAPRAAKN